MNLNESTFLPFHSFVSREFKKLRRQLQGKRHIEIELCVNLSLLRLFHVDHIVQNNGLSLAWHEVLVFLYISLSGFDNL